MLLVYYLIEGKQITSCVAIKKINRQNDECVAKHDTEFRFPLRHDSL